MSVTTALERAAHLLAERLTRLEDRLQESDPDAQATLWRDYVATAGTLAQVVTQIAPGRRGELLTTAQMAERLGISSKTLLKRKANGLATPALQLGKRGRAAIRWRGDEAVR
jgi:hypothetical protein